MFCHDDVDAAGVANNDTGGTDILTFYDDRRYRLATAFTLAYPYGFTRIMSSYSWDGGPHGSVPSRYVSHLVQLVSFSVL